MLIAFYKTVNKKAPQYLMGYLQLKVWLLLILGKDLQFTLHMLKQNVIAILSFLTVSHNGTTWIVT